MTISKCLLCERKAQALQGNIHFGRIKRKLAIKWSPFGKDLKIKSGPGDGYNFRREDHIMLKVKH